MSRLPIIGVTACATRVGLQTEHIIGYTYAWAVATVAQGVQVVSPSSSDGLGPTDIINGSDGQHFTDFPFVAPSSAFALSYDHTTLSLIRAAVPACAPMLGDGHHRHQRVPATPRA